MENFVSRNIDIFSGLGKYPGRVAIHLKEDAKPVVHYKKRFPNSVVKKLKPKLDALVEGGIISPVTHPTDWANNIQVVEKSNGDLRICLDPKPLNACIKREHFLIPTIDRFASELCNKKIFTVLDCSNGFWQIELDDKSTELTTFMTPFGRYKFNRLAFGLNCAPEIFQRIMVLVFGAIKPCQKDKDAILNMKKPTDKHGVMRLLGLFKYLAKFIPNLSKLTAELRELTRKDVPFEWNEKHETELNNLTKLITSEPILRAYDPEKPVIIKRMHRKMELEES